jgi:hypothetical protein
LLLSRSRGRVIDAEATTARKATASPAAEAPFQTKLACPVLALLGHIHLEDLPSAKVKSIISNWINHEKHTAE